MGKFCTPSSRAYKIYLRPTGDKLGLKGGITMIILDETKLKNRTIAMIGEDYDMPVSVKSLEYPEWYERELDDIVDRFKFDVDEFKEKLISAIMNGIKIDFKLK